MGFFDEDEKNKIMELKELTVPQACHYGRFPKKVLYVLIQKASETGFPVLPRTYRKRRHLIHAGKFIEWREKLHEGKIAIAHLFT